MKEFTYTVQDPNGLHARPAGKLAAFAKQFSSEIRVQNNEKDADCKRLLSLMSLGAVCGTALQFRITGEDEENASQELQRYCNEVLYTGESV